MRRALPARSRSCSVPAAEIFHSYCSSNPVRMSRPGEDVPCRIQQYCRSSLTLRLRPRPKYRSLSVMAIGVDPAAGCLRGRISTGRTASPSTSTLDPLSPSQPFKPIGQDRQDLRAVGRSSVSSAQDPVAVYNDQGEEEEVYRSKVNKNKCRGQHITLQL